MSKTREKTREKLLRITRVNPKLSSGELATALGITREGVEWQIRKLMSESRLERIGPAKGGHWEVKE